MRPPAGGPAPPSWRCGLWPTWSTATTAAAATVLADGKARPTTRPAGPTGQCEPRPGFLDAARLARHFAATRADDAVGLHALDADGLGRWVAVDIDNHGGTDADPAVNGRYASVLFDRLAGLGFTPVLTDSDGKGGFHLRALLDRPTPGEVLFWFGRWLVRDFAAHGFESPPETFPKQAALSDTKRFGSWLRLPGRHPKRDQWGRVYDGAGWLAGADAADLLLGIDAAGPAAVPLDAVADFIARVTRRTPAPPQSAPRATGPAEGGRPGDDFNRRGSWAEVLRPHGWRPTRHRADGSVEWVRPNKDGGVSATTGFCRVEGRHLLYCFTTNAGPFPTGKGVGLFEAFTRLNHGGDFRAAAAALAAAGYGRRSERAG